MKMIPFGFEVTDEDVLLAVASVGGDVSMTDAERLAQSLRVEDRARIAKAALKAGSSLEEQALAAQEAIAKHLLVSGLVVIADGVSRVQIPERPECEVLYAQSDELDTAAQITLYKPARLHPGTTEIAGFELRRDGMAPFMDRPRPVKWHDDIPYIDAVSANGNQSLYTYMLLHPVAVVDRAAGAIIPAESQRVVGMTQWDRMQVDQTPGHYFVTARDDDGRTACLLGPFDRHIDALLNVQAARYLLHETLGDRATWVGVGTTRYDVAYSKERNLMGRFNERMLKPAPARADSAVELG